VRRDSKIKKKHGRSSRAALVILVQNTSSFGSVFGQLHARVQVLVYTSFRAGFRKGGAGPPPTGGLPPVQFKLINCKKNSTKDAPKLAFLSSKIEKFSGEGGTAPSPDLSPSWEGDTP